MTVQMRLADPTSCGLRRCSASAPFPSTPRSTGAIATASTSYFLDPDGNLLELVAYR